MSLKEMAQFYSVFAHWQPLQLVSVALLSYWQSVLMVNGITFHIGKHVPVFQASYRYLYPSITANILPCTGLGLLWHPYIMQPSHRTKRLADLA